jgi:uncharacterized protein YndB with AHSA1/START domain
MKHVEQTVTVDLPIDEVFAYLADGRNNPDWRVGVLEIERTSAADGEGAIYRQVLKGPGGRRIAGDYKVTRFAPPNRLEFAVVAGPARPTGRFELSSAGEGHTIVTFSLDLKPTGLMRLMGGMITKQMHAEVGQLRRLKANLER